MALHIKCCKVLLPIPLGPASLHTRLYVAPTSRSDTRQLMRHFESTATFGGDKRADEDWMARAEMILFKWRSYHRATRTCGQRAYCLAGSGAEVEKALLDYAHEIVVSSGLNFRWLDVDDILPLSTTKACGVEPRVGETGTHQMQYLVENAPGYCLSGTAEMGIPSENGKNFRAHVLRNRLYSEEELPAYYFAKSRCYRAEAHGTGNLKQGLYRVHEFNKLEMFAVSTEKQSEQVLTSIIEIQKRIFTGLGLHCRLVRMPAEDLSNAAAVKFDIEAWMPGRRDWGELSSASNCTDYQARRLGIRYLPRRMDNQNSGETPIAEEKEGGEMFAHTCNGTALASTRTIVALLETHQDRHKGVNLPKELKKWLPSQRTTHPIFIPAPEFHSEP